MAAYKICKNEHMSVAVAWNSIISAMQFKLQNEQNPSILFHCICSLIIINCFSNPIQIFGDPAKHIHFS